VSPLSWKVAEIDPPRESKPMLLTIDPFGVGEKLGEMPASLETPSTLETSGKKLTAFARLEMSGSIQSTLRPVEPKLTVAGNVTTHWLGAWKVTIIPVVDPSYVAVRLVDEFSVSTML
jgi:hypothetical protein